MELEKELKSHRRLGLHEVLNAKNDGEVGYEGGHDRVGRRQWCCAWHITRKVTGKGGEGEMSDDEVCKWGHDEGETRDV